MDKKSTLKEELLALKKSGELSDKYYELAVGCIRSFLGVFKFSGLSTLAAEDILRLFFQLAFEQLRHPHRFEPYHRKIRHPIDYYQFGLEFFRPLVDFTNSKIEGRDSFDRIALQLGRGENVIFLSNHQTESDPQLLAILLEKDYPKIAEETIYVAGERVVTDPMAIPFSLGTDLLCIYSKRYELTPEKMHHNKRTMDLMSRLLKEGGKVIYVAPSGGRDRKNGEGKIVPAPFDPSSVELFYLMAKKAQTPTHFYPLALNTYDILPPPETVQVELGEERVAKRAPIGVALGPECDMEIGTEFATKEERRKAKTDRIWTAVCELYERIKS